jgi:curved DNA-binding protein
MEYKDYYKIMGLERNASSDDIKKSYRKLARKYHPDVSKEANAEEKFKSLGEAYEVLKDPQKRAAYDQLGANWQAGQDFKPPPGWGYAGGGGGQAGGPDMGGFGDVSDFFESLFGGGGGMGGRGGRQQQRYSRQPQATPGEDYHGKFQVNLEDAFRGGAREVQIPITEMDSMGQRFSRTRTLRVKIPAGIRTGQQIRLTGQGGPGMSGGAQGDLYLEVEIAKNKIFDLMGNDIYYTLPIAPWEAVSGATIPVPTVDGKVELKIPPNSQGGQQLRLKGRGMPGKTPGDQYVLLKIIIPQPLSAKAKELFSQLAAEVKIDSREKMGG